MVTKAKPKPSTSEDLATLNGATAPTKPAKKAAAPISGAPASTSFNPTTASAPTSAASLFGVSTAIAGTPLMGDNSDLLGSDTKAGNAPRTILDAAQALTKATPTSIAQLQAKLYAAGVLHGQISWGVADKATQDAWNSVVESSAREGKSITDTISSAMAAGPLAIGSPTATSSAVDVAETDPAQAAVELQNAFAAEGVGRQPNAAEYKAFQQQLDSGASNKALGGSTAQKDQQKIAQENAIKTIAGQSTSLTGTPSAGETTQVQQLAGLLGENLTPISTVTTNVDPASEATIFAQQIAAKIPGAQTHAEQSTDADITKAAAAMGVQLSATARNNIASQVDANTKATGSPDVNLLNQLVAKQFKMPSDPSQLTGDAATLFNDIQQKAGQYLIPMGNASIGSWVTKGIQNQSYAGALTGDTEAEVEQWLRQQSAIQYPWLAASTQNFQTVTPWDATGAYRTAISDTMQLGNPDAVNLLDPKYSKLLQAGPNGTPPDLSTIRQTLMTDPQYGYENTPLATQQAYTLGVGVLKGMGVNVTGV